MESLCISSYVWGEMHHLYEVDRIEDLLPFPWVVKYDDYKLKGKGVSIKENDNLYWIPAKVSPHMPLIKNIT